MTIDALMVFTSLPVMMSYRSELAGIGDPSVTVGAKAVSVIEPAGTAMFCALLFVTVGANPESTIDPAGTLTEFGLVTVGAKPVSTSDAAGTEMFCDTATVGAKPETTIDPAGTAIEFPPPTVTVSLTNNPPGTCL